MHITTVISACSLIVIFICALLTIGSRFLSWYLSRHLRIRYGLKLKIGSIGFFTVQGLYLQLSDGTTLEVEKIWLSSNLFCKRYCSFLVVCLGDVRLQVHLSKLLESNPMHKVPPDKYVSVAPKRIQLSRRLTSIVKGASIHIFNVSVMQLGSPSLDCLLHTTAQELALHFLAQGSKCRASLNVTSAVVRIFQHPQDTNDSCLANVSVNVESSVTLSSKNIRHVHAITLCIRQPEVTLYDGFSAEKLLESFVPKGAFRRPSQDLELAHLVNKESEHADSTSQNKLQSLLDICPEKASITIESSTIKVLRENWQRGLCLEMQSISGELLKGDLCSLSLSLGNMAVTSDHSKVLALNVADFKCKLQEKHADVNMRLTSFHIAYCEEDYWLRLLPSRDSQQPSKSPTKGISQWLLPLVVHATAELEDVSGSAKTLDCGQFSVGLVHARFTADAGMGCHEGGIGDMDISSELMLETVWCTMGTCELAKVQQLKRFHFWNVPLSAGMMLLKVSLTAHDIRIQCMLCSVHWEINSQLADLLAKYRLKPRKATAAQGGTARALSLHLNMSDTDVFGITSLNTGLAVRVDSLNLDYGSDRTDVNVDGCAVSIVTPSGQHYTCVAASDVRLGAVYVKNARLNYKDNQKEVQLQFHEEVSLNWNTTFHMTTLTLVQEIKALKSSLKGPVEEDVGLETSAPPARRITYNICFQGQSDFEFILSHDHRVRFATCDLNVRLNPTARSANTEMLTIYFDHHPIFTFQQVQYTTIPAGQVSTFSRNTFKDLLLEQNNLWTLTIDEMHVVFPYGYNFAEAFSEQLVNIVKWLKLVHQRTKKPFTDASPLPSDFSIKVRLLTVEIGDDPFEVKLRDNYELLEDEYHESIKRKKVLDERIGLRTTHRMHPGLAKVSEVYASLTKKNADIYILRSRQLYSAADMRTHLVVWTFEQLDILALADPSYHGTDKVVKVIQQLDPESPYPEEGVEFSTLWCRTLNGSLKTMTCQLRDFPLLLVDWRDLNWWGILAGAEQEASPRAIRSSVVEVSKPWSNTTIYRSMPSLKYYHDLTWDMGSLRLTYGACWEPVVAQVNLAMESISRPSADKSPPLAWWDKVRLILHGRLTVSARQISMVQHVSLNPYNDTELFQVSWSNAIIEWTNGKIVMKVNLDAYVHTASRYNESCLLHVPDLKIAVKLDWACIGNPFDHHSVMPCAPDKIPEYSSNQEHDSYRAFRSQNLNVSLSLETKPVALETADSIPTLLLYSSTLKWIENLKAILGGLPRLTRRGPLFGNTKPRKTQLTRHLRSIQLAVSLHKFQVCFWTSLARQHGFELLGGRLQLSSEHTLGLEHIHDGLAHRPRAIWSVAYMNCELGDSEVWLYNVNAKHLSEETGTEDTGEEETPEQDVAHESESSPQRRYFLSVSRVSYGRETKVRASDSQEEEDTPTHLLAVHGLRGAWTKHNRDVAFGLFDSYVGAKLLRRNLSTDALRGFWVDSQQQPPTEARPSPRLTRRRASPAVSMLEQLVSEGAGPRTVYTEDVEAPSAAEQLHGMTACQANDALHKNWLIELVNSQVMLRGCETSGYVIVSAAKAQILQRVHSPVWKENTLVSKTTWVGSLECMQYYATVDAGKPGLWDSDGVMWLTLDNIEERGCMVISDPPDLVGSGQSVGGVVSSTVGGAPDPGEAPLQLQRIISRCGCQFFYASYGEDVDPDSLEEVPPLVEEEEPWEQETAVDAFTLMHHDLEVCTNPLQYAMILDLLNNLLLYVEPHRREALARLQRMRFQLQLLSSGEDQRVPILQLQNQVRDLLSMQRHLEREAYKVQRSLHDNPDDEDLSGDLIHLEKEIQTCKEQLNATSEELAMMINCYRETQVAALKKCQRAADRDHKVSVIRRAEVCFKHARWRLTDVDGQLGIADLVLSNFLYSRVTNSNDSIEHLLELGYIKVTNLLPNQAYKEVLHPTELQPNVPWDRQRALRIFCRVRAPVGGISVKEHLELNLVPLTIGLTHAFTTRMIRFFFPGRDTEKTEEQPEEEPKQVERHTKKTKRSATLSSNRDDIEKMKERAEKNQTFLYIKIPEVPLRVSYKGEKEKNFEDLQDFALVLPTIELHNRTCTWLDLLMLIKTDVRKVLIPQAIKQKLQIKSNQASVEDSAQPQEEDKARLLLGAKLLGGPEKTAKKGFFK
ncbi:protein hobbit-like [Ornithodoros turicata]|uniref:protein hobbit-like n=1 Tax=Ornithodoros turicata TaxID=34597 RepID=UPI003139419F